MDEFAFNKLLGEKVKTYRESKRLKQKDLATELGLGRTSIANIEKGLQNLNLFGVYKLCVKLGVTPTELFPDFDKFKSLKQKENKVNEKELLDSVFRKHGLRRLNDD